MFEKILLVACLAGSTRNQFTMCNIEIEDKRQRAMPDILEFAPLDFTWAHRQARMFAFQSLYTGHFIQAFSALSLFCSFRRLFIDFVDVGNFFVKVFFIAGVNQ